MRAFLALAATALVAAPAVAGSYTATTASPAPEAKIVARDIVWNCAGATCRGATPESRPAVLCQALAKRAGPLAGFAADGRAFTAAELERCNAAAPKKADEAVAEAR